MLFVRDYIAAAMVAVMILGPMAAGAMRAGDEPAQQPAGPSAAAQPVPGGNAPVAGPGRTAP